MKDSGLYKKNIGLNRAAADSRLYTEQQVVLCRVWDATLVMSPDPDEADSKYIWRYRVAPAKVSWSGLGNLPTTTFLDHTPPADPVPLYYAFSISELGNTNNLYSYGQDPADFPSVSITPIRIPDDTPVVCLAHTLSNNGDFIYIIINTQAIGGPCA